jgi:hypothetical protein
MGFGDISKDMYPNESVSHLNMEKRLLIDEIDLMNRK